MEESIQTIICKNCQTSFQGNYCPHCGQVIHGRFTFQKIIKDTLYILTNVDHGFWLTLKTLVVRPEKLLTDYLQGITRPYQNPFQALFFIAGISAFIMIQFGFLDEQTAMQNELIKEMQGGEFSEKQQELRTETSQLLKQYFGFFMMSFVPFYALASYLIFRRKYQYLFSEFLIINTFLMILPLLLGVITHAFLAVLGLSNQIALNTSLNISLSVLYYQYVFKRFYQLSWIKSFFLSFLHYILSFLFFILIVFLTSLVGTIIFLMWSKVR